MMEKREEEIHCPPELFRKIGVLMMGKREEIHCPPKFSRNIGVLMMGKREEIHCPPQFGGPSTPWLIYPNDRSVTSHTFCNILEPNKNCIKKIPQMCRRMCNGSSNGWLVLRDMISKVDLWNPVTNETVHLPDFKLEDDDDFRVRTWTLSSDPADPNCMVLFFCTIPLIIYCQPGDTHWTRHSLGDEEIHNIRHAVVCNGTIYATTWVNKLMIIRRESSGCLSLRLLNVERPKSPVGVIRICVYSLESYGELFRVYMYYSSTADAVSCIHVFKLDSPQMAWVQLEDLGGQVFFLSPNAWPCASCFADEQSGLEGDCIYFTYGKDKGLYVFHMKDGSISVSLPCPDLGITWYAPFWFTSNRMVDKTKDNERRTIINDKKMMVKQSLKEMSKEVEEVETINSLFFNLPKELQPLIPTHLTSVVDYMNFRAASKPLRSLAPPIQWKSPWLMSVQNGVGFYLDPECNSIYRMNIPELLGCTIHFSKDGWLLMSKGFYSMFFFDPFTKRKIKVPDLTENCCFEGISFSSLPTSSDCVIFGFGCSGPVSITICWCRLGQKIWSLIDMDISFPVSRSSPVFYDGAFYCLSLEGDLGVFDVNEKWTVHLNPQNCSRYRRAYLVECDGELLSVFHDDGGNTIIISRFDRTTKCWVEVKSLSNKMLFLSSSTSMVIETKEKKLQNTIFLARVWSEKKNDVVFYSFETKKYHSLSRSSFSSCDFYSTTEQLYCSWIQPNLVWKDIP